MAKSFILYTDIAPMLDLISDEDNGKLFRAVVQYATDGTRSELPQAAGVLFEAIRQNIDRNAEKWAQVAKIRSDAGKKGGAPKGNTNAQKTSKINQKQAKQAVNGNVNGNVIEEEKERRDKSLKEIYQEENSVKPNFQTPPFEVIEKYLCGKFKWKSDEVRMFYDQCEANGWTTENGNPIKSWKAAAQNWKYRKDRAEMKAQKWNY